MNLFSLFADKIASALGALQARGSLPAGLDLARVVVEPPRDPTHGDLATNAAMALAKDAKLNPRALADLLVAELARDESVAEATVAGPGFINLRLKPAIFTEVLRAAIAEGPAFGRGTPDPAKPRVNVEYVSANPTGPMHVGHGRGAVFGDALANLLAFSGRDVTREYYINDAGAQVDVLARSAYHRYREALGEPVGEIEEGLYPGDYLKRVGQALVEAYRTELRTLSESDWLPIVRQFSIESMLLLIILDLRQIGIAFHVFFSERSLVGERCWVENSLRLGQLWVPASYRDHWYRSETKRSPLFGYLFEKLADFHASNSESDFEGAELGFQSATFEGNDVESAMETLRARDLIYEGRLPPPKGQKDEDWEDREQTLFRSTAFGDDVDRPLMKSDGGYTYFASDIAYHKSKYDRGFAEMIDVWGADHGGYVKRMQAAVKAITDGKGTLDIKLVQLVKLMRNGEPVKMSKRSGEFVTLREVIDEVGRDAIRFMMLFRKNDATLEFDLAKVLEQSKDNPVFYVQYAHARCASIFRQAGEQLPDLAQDAASLAGADLGLLEDDGERDLVKLIAQYPRLIEQAAASHEPHRVAFYLYDLAQALHALWNKGKDSPQLRFINHNARELTRARLALVHAVRGVLASGLGILGVSSPNEM